MFIKDAKKKKEIQFLEENLDIFVGFVLLVS